MRENIQAFLTSRLELLNRDNNKVLFSGLCSDKAELETILKQNNII
jgi:hypothetical protein